MTCGETQPEPCTEQCVAGCQCKRGKWWDPVIHTCLAQNKCTPQKCESNKKWEKCTTHCPKTCGVTYHFCIAGCAPACACPKKKWWDPVRELRQEGRVQSRVAPVDGQRHAYGLS